MPNQVAPRVANAVDPTASYHLPRSTRRRVGRAIDRQAVRAVVQAASAQADAHVADTRVQEAAYVTDTALLLTARLSKHEEDLIRMAPLGEARYRHLVDNFAMQAGDEIRGLGR